MKSKIQILPQYQRRRDIPEDYNAEHLRITPVIFKVEFKMKY